MDAYFTVNNHRAKSRCCEVIEMAGELDVSSAPHLENVLDRMMVVPDDIIFDVSELSFIDSTGLKLLTSASTLVDGRIWLKGCNAHLRKLLEITGIDDLFCLEDECKQPTPSSSSVERA